MSQPAAKDFAREFASAYNAGNLSAVLALYASDAKLVDARGREHHGTQAIAAMLQPGLHSGALMTVENIQAVESGNVALLRNRFRIESQGQTVVDSTSVEVLWFIDGSWKLAIDMPYGTTQAAE